MGDIYQYEEELSIYPVHTRWQRSLVHYLWSLSGGDDLFVRGLYFINCSHGELHFKRVQHECARFRRFNKSLLSSELAIASKNYKLYFRRLFQINHYMLLFNVAEMLYVSEVCEDNDLIMYLLKLFDY